MNAWSRLPPGSRRAVIGIPLLAVAAYIPTLLDIQLQFELAQAAIFGLCILSLVLLTGYTGQVSLCQLTFAAVGGFATATMVESFHFNFFLAVPFGVAAAFALGVVVGLPALRLGGILLAVVTLGVALVFDKYVFEDHIFEFLTGGKFGRRIDSASLFGITMDSQQHVLPAYWLLLALFGIVAFMLVNLHNSGSGRRFRAIRDSELAAATMGVNLTRYKLLAFGISAAIAGLAGSFFPLVQGTITGGTGSPFDVFHSLTLAAFAVLFGIRFVPAAAIGGVFSGITNDLVSRLSAVMVAHNLPEIPGNVVNLILGSLLVAQIILLPDGVWGDLREHAAHLRHRLAPRPAEADITVT